MSSKQLSKDMTFSEDENPLNSKTSNKTNKKKQKNDSSDENSSEEEDYQQVYQIRQNSMHSKTKHRKRSSSDSSSDDSIIKSDDSISESDNSVSASDDDTESCYQGYKQSKQRSSKTKLSSNQQTVELLKMDENQNISIAITNSKTKINEYDKIIQKQFIEEINILLLIPSNSKIQYLYENLQQNINDKNNLQKEYRQILKECEIIIQQLIMVGQKFSSEVEQIFKTQNYITKVEVKEILEKNKKVCNNLLKIKTEKIEQLIVKIKMLNTQDIVNELRTFLITQYRQSDEETTQLKQIENKVTTLKSEKLKFEFEKKKKYDVLQCEIKIEQNLFSKLDYEMNLICKQIQQKEDFLQFNTQMKNGKSQKEINHFLKIFNERKESYEKLQREIEDTIIRMHQLNQNNYLEQAKLLNHKEYNFSDVSKRFVRIFVCDQSLSIKNQHQILIDSIVTCIEQLKSNNSNDSVVVIKFDDKAEVSYRKNKISNIDSQAFRKKISHFSGGDTNYVNAFSKLQEVLMQLSDNEVPLIIFLTGGDDKGSNNQYSQVLLNLPLKEDSIFYTLGFGSQINEQKLKEICNLSNKVDDCRKDFGSGYQQLYHRILSPSEISETYINININNNQNLQFMLNKKSLSKTHYEKRAKSINEWKEDQISILRQQHKQIYEDINFLTQPYEYNQDKVTEIENQLTKLRQQEFDKNKELDKTKNEIQNKNNEIKRIETSDQFLKEKELQDSEQQYINLIDHSRNQQTLNYSHLEKLGFHYNSQVVQFSHMLNLVTENQEILQQQVKNILDYVDKHAEHSQDIEDKVVRSEKNIQALKTVHLLESHINQYFLKICGPDINTLDTKAIKKQILTHFDTEIMRFIQINDLEQQLDAQLDSITYIDIIDNYTDKDQKVMNIINKLYPDNGYQQFHSLNFEYKKKLSKNKKENKVCQKQIKLVKEQIKSLEKQMSQYQNRINTSTSLCTESRFQQIMAKLEQKLERTFEELENLINNQSQIENNKIKLQQNQKLDAEKIYQKFRILQQEKYKEVFLIEKILKILESAYQEATKYLYWYYCTQPIKTVCNNIQQISNICLEKENFFTS